MLYQYLPIMVLPLFASIEKLDATLIEASLDLGAKRSTTFRRVVLPLTLPGVMAGLVLVFVPAMGNFVAPTLIGGGKDLYLSTLLAQSFLLARDWPFGSAVATFLSVIVVLSLLALALADRRNAAKGASA
jgi:spermidine/putrescine transport system permease protein